LDDSSVNIAARPWVKPEDYWSLQWDIPERVKLRFDSEGITIPFPQRDVHISGRGAGEIVGISSVQG
jgi:small conductance mechanosensitive channel